MNTTLIKHGYELTMIFQKVKAATGISDLNELAEAVAAASGADKVYIVLAVKAYFAHLKAKNGGAQ